MLGALALVAGGPAAWAASTTTTLFTSPNSPSSGAVITMTAQVSSTSFTVAGGTVTFTDTYNGVQETLGVAQVQSTNGSAGTAILKTEVGGVGAHQFLANYSGTSTFAASSSSVAAVTFAAPYLTSTALASSGSGPFTLTGTVSAYGPSAPTGNVSFVDATTGFTMGTVALNSSTLQTGFAPYQSYSIANTNNGNTGGTVAPAIGDFNNDGRLDYAVPSNSGPIVILLGTGSGTFTTGTALSTSNFTPTSVVVGDFNGDGKQDLAVLGASGSINVYAGNGDGTFGSPVNVSVTPFGQSNPASRILAQGDFNRDGIADLVATNSALNSVYVVLGIGNGNFLPGTSYSTVSSGTAGSKPWNVVVGDVNKDGDLDLVVASDGSSAFSVLQGKGDGTFKTAITVNTPGSQVGSVGLGDFNGDGVPDVITSSAPNQNIFILTNTTTTAGAAPTFTSGTSYPVSNGPYYLTVGDFNRDGKLDIIAATNGVAITGPPAVPAATAVGVLLGNGSGGFGSATYYQVGAASYFANAADINGDDQIDLTAVTTNGVAVLLSGESESATLSNVTYQGCGAQSVVATYNGDSNYGTSTSSGMPVTPSTLTTTLGLAGNPVNGVVGQQYMFTATLSPYSSGSYTSNGQTITFYANGSAFGTATLSNGVATLLYTPNSTGSYTVSASYTNGCSSTGGFASVTSSNIAVTVKQASTITWNNPAAITYGTPLSSTQLNATNTVAGTFSYSPAAGTILGVGTQTLTTTFTPSDTTTYGTETATVQITVNKAAATITWPTPTPITYGTPLSNLQLDATASPGVVQVPLSSYYNATGIYGPGTTYSTGGFDNDGYSYSSATLSGSVTFAGMNFTLGPVGSPDAVYGTGGTITLPQGKYTDLYMLGAMVNNVAAGQTFTVTYTDGSTTTLNQNMSDWFNADGWPGESVVNCAEKRNYQNGTQQADSVCVYGYDINLDQTKTVQSVTLPNNRNIVMLSMDLATPQIPGTFVYSPASGTVEPVGTDTLNVTFTPTDSTDYSPVTGSVSLQVTAPVGTIITPTINWPTPADISYGTALSSTQLDAVAMATALPTPQVPTDQLNVLSTSTDGTAYGLAGFDGSGNSYSYKQLNNGSITYVGTTFTLGQPTVPNAISNGAVYTLPSQGNYSTVYLIGAATADNQTNQPFVLTYSTGNPVTQTVSLSSWTNPQLYTGETTVATSNYVNTQSGGETNTKNYLYGYSIAADPTRQLVSVSVPNNRKVVIMALGFGTNNQVAVPGTYTYTPASGTVLPVGNGQTLSVQFTPSNTQAYSSASGSVKINVVKATPVITWPTPAAIAAGTALSSTQLNATTTIAGTFVYNPSSGTVLPSGTQTLKVTFTPNDTTDYNTATAQVQIVVGNSATSIAGSGGFQSSECCFFSQPTPYTVTLGGMSVAPTGNVSVTFGGQTLATGTLSTGGSSATSSVSLLLNSIYFLVGNNTVTINYLGDNNYSPSSATAVVPLRNPAIGANPATVNGSTSTLVIPFAFPVNGTMSFSYNPGNGGIADFTDTGNGTCSSGTLESAGFVCTLSMTFTPGLPGIRKEAIQVNFTPTSGSAEPTLYLFVSGLGSAAQLALNTATQLALNTSLSQPQSLTFNPTDKNTATLYVANSNLGILDTLASTGGTASPWNSSNTSSLRYPTDVMFDDFGNLIVADEIADKVFSFAPGGAASTVSTGTVKLGTPTAARLDFANNIYVADAGAGSSPVPQVVAIPGETYDTTLVPSVLLNGSQVSYPQALAVDNTGSNLYVGDGDLNTILQIVLGTTTVNAIAISPCDATVTSCAWNSPAGIAFDPNGDMFVTDSGQRVLMVPANHSSGGQTTQLALTGLNNPTGITLDGAGNVYVTDLNTSVEKLQVNLGTVKVGSSASTIVTNTGNLNLTITALTFGNATTFAESDNCKNVSIAPGGTCTITFTNPSNVTANDTLTITSNSYSPAGVKINLTK